MHSTPRVLMWPRAHVAAVLTLRQQEPIKSVDFSFVGAMRGDAKTSASRQWVRSFALRHFTNDSEFVDTSPRSAGDLRKYRPLGPWDKTRQRHSTAFRPKSVGKSSCQRAACDLDYYRSLARAKYTLAPAGDRPWSQRFFEAIMAGSIPIVANNSHVGRTPAERALPYTSFSSRRCELLSMPDRPVR